MSVLADARRDLRFAIRIFVKKSGFSAVAVLTLALGIGINTAVFSVVESVLLRPLPYPEAERLVIPRNQDVNGGPAHNFTYPDYQMWKREGVFASIATFGTFRADLMGAGEPARVLVMEVGEDYFPTVRVDAVRGRTFQTEDHVPGSEHVALLGEPLWRSRYGADPDVLGRTIRLDEVPHTIAGVVPAEAAAPSKVDIWTPMQPDVTADHLTDWDNGAFTAIARLKEGETLDSTNAVLTVLAARVAEEHPVLRAKKTSLALPLIRFITGADTDRALWILLGAACFVLLIGCVNIANLMLTLGARRRREFALRSALGAGRFRLIRQQLTEGCILALAGGALGVIFSSWLVGSVIALAPDGIPRIEDVRMNGSVLLFALVVSLVSAWIFSLVPAFRATGERCMNGLNEGMYRVTAGRRERHGRHVVIGLELALSLTLLAGAGYALQSLGNLTRVELGFEHSRLLHVPLSPPEARYEPGIPVTNFFENAVEEVSALPGVESATVRSAMPIGGGGFYVFRSYLPEGRPEPPEGEEISGPWTVVGHDHFRVMGIPLLQGRGFRPSDGPDAVPVMIVNRRFAEMMFGDEDPIGKRVRSWRDEDVYREIVGVVGNVRGWDISYNPSAGVYIPHRQNRWREMRLVIRTAGEPPDMIPAVRRAIGSLDPNLVVANVSTMDEVYAANLAGPRFLSTLLLMYAVIALILSAIGIYGVLSYLVSLRTREIGVRMIFGAGRRDIMRMIVGESLTPLVVGILAGLAGVFALGRTLQSLLFEVSLIQPLVVLGICTTLVAVSLLAIFIPAARAARLDLAEALRVDQ